MKCPVCGHDCVKDAHEITENLQDIFSPCPDCKGRTLDKQAPLKDLSYREPCACGKRFIDEVFAHMYVILVEEGVLSPNDPLKSVGMPLIHPGFAMKNPPYLTPDSLVLLSPYITKPAALRLSKEVPEVRGVIKSSAAVPGLSDIDLDGLPDTYELLAGCDVRANVFFTQEEPLVIYKQQTALHIEFPRGYDPKIINTGVKIKSLAPKIFTDPFSGAGTLGLIGALLGVPQVILSDIWYAAAFWAAYNVKVNRKSFDIEEVTIHADYNEMKDHPVVKKPLKIAETEGGTQSIEVYQADFREMYTVLPESVDLTVIDLFGKDDLEKVQQITGEWKAHVGGEIFIP